MMAIAAVLLLLLAVARAQFRATPLFQWDSVPFDWLSSSQEQQFIANGYYNATNCAIAGIKSYKGAVMVTVPRWRSGVPATLLLLDAQRQVLMPWPSWSAQAPDDPQNALFFNVQSMEIDPVGRVWVLDVGRQNFLDADPSTLVNRAPALLVFNFANGRLLDQYSFPDAVLPANASFANDIVVDWRNDVAFISDTWGQGGLVVVDLRNHVSRRFDHASLQGDASTVMQFPEGPFAAASPSDGIALTPNGTLFYCSISTTQLWKLDATVFADFSQSSGAVAATVQLVGDKRAFSDGLAMTNNSDVIWGDLTGGRIVATSAFGAFSPHALVSKPLAMEWPDTFAFDETDGSLLFTSNRLHLFLNNTMAQDGTTINFRAYRVTGPGPIYSYMH